MCFPSAGLSVPISIRLEAHGRSQLLRKLRVSAVCCTHLQHNARSAPVFPLADNPGVYSVWCHTGSSDLPPCCIVQGWVWTNEHQPNSDCYRRQDPYCWSYKCHNCCILDKYVYVHCDHSAAIVETRPLPQPMAQHHSCSQPNENFKRHPQDTKGC